MTPADFNKSLGGYQPEIELGSHERMYTPEKILYIFRLIRAVKKATGKADRTFQEVRTFVQQWLKTDLKASSNYTTSSSV